MALTDRTMVGVEQSGTFALGDLPLSVLRDAVASGVNHIDTSDYHGPHVTNQLIHDALHPYSDDLVIVTKVGAPRGKDGSVLEASSPNELISAVHDNLSWQGKSGG
jgi:pyridoxine 4-dehydrogenase